MERLLLMCHWSGLNHMGTSGCKRGWDFSISGLGKCTTYADLYYLPPFLHMLSLSLQELCVVLIIVFISWMKLRLRRIKYLIQGSRAGK